MQKTFQGRTKTRGALGKGITKPHNMSLPPRLGAALVAAACSVIHRTNFQFTGLKSILYPLNSTSGQTRLTGNFLNLVV